MNFTDIVRRSFVFADIISDFARRTEHQSPIGLLIRYGNAQQRGVARKALELLQGYRVKLGRGQRRNRRRQVRR